MSAEKCKWCGFRVRGAQHEAGSHHNGKSRADRKLEQARDRKRKAALAGKR